MQTPSKQPEISSMTHEEEDEMLHDISKLQDQVQQRSLSQKLIEAKIKGMVAKMDGIEEKLEGNMEDLKIYLTKLLQEMLTNGERVVNETLDENKRNVNHDSKNDNI